MTQANLLAVCVNETETEARQTMRRSPRPVRFIPQFPGTGRRVHRRPPAATVSWSAPRVPKESRGSVGKNVFRFADRGSCCFSEVAAWKKLPP